MTRIAGGLVDRSRTWRFTFDGREMVGHPGDTLASALMANGVQLVGRSFKYHRPRGIVSAGPEEPNALVTLRTCARAEPNTRATVAELFDGLAAASQNHVGSLRHDLMAVNDLAAPLIQHLFQRPVLITPSGNPMKQALSTTQVWLQFWITLSPSLLRLKSQRHR